MKLSRQFSSSSLREIDYSSRCGQFVDHCHLRKASVFSLGYAWNELRRRLGRTVVTAIGLAAGVGLVMGIIGVSQGLSDAQNKALSPLNAVGTDIIVTRTVAPTLSTATTTTTTPANRFGGGGGPFSQLSRRMPATWRPFPAPVPSPSIQPRRKRADCSALAC